MTWIVHPYEEPRLSFGTYPRPKQTIMSLRRGDAGHGEDGRASTVLLDAFLWSGGSLNSDDFGGAAKAGGMTPTGIYSK